MSVGVCEALGPDDIVFGSYRSHAMYLAKGGNLNQMMAELYGKATGTSRGKGGSMHLADFSIGILGESGIVGSALPVAVGAALGSKMQGNDRVVVSFFGDGASNQGACHEAMNLASIWNLPVIFLCENNQYAVTTHFTDTVAVENISDRAQAYNMPGVLVDGQDIMAMYEVTKEAVQRGRSGLGPTLIEARTYRYQEHSEALNRILREEYRSEEELQEWKQRDPIDLFKALLIEQNIYSEEEINELQDNVAETVNDCILYTSPRTRD